MPDLAKLVVKLEAESAKLHRDLDKANNKLSLFEKAANSSKKALSNFAKLAAIGLAATAGLLATMARRTIDLADEMGKLSQSTGLTVETLSRLRYGADLSGVSFEAMTKGVGRLQRAMFDADQGMKSQADAFDALGIAIVDPTGKLRDTEQVMIDVAEQFSQMEDGATKAALAQILFGKAGVQMIPFLNQGAKGLREMAAEADAFGITMDGKLTAAAERTNDNMTRLKTAMEGVFLRVIAQAMPRIEAVTIAMVQWAKDSNGLANALSFLGNVMKVIATGAVILKAVFSSVGKVLAGVAAAVVLASKGEFTQAGKAIGDSFSDASDSVAGDMATIDSIWREVPKNIASKSDEISQQIASPIIQADEKIKESVDNVRERLKTLDSEMKKALKKSDDISKQFKDRNSSLNSAPIDLAKADTNDVGYLELQAQQSLKNGDIDGAVKKLEAAYDILDAMKAAGTESSTVLEGLGNSLARVGEEVSKAPVTDLESKIAIDITSAVQQAAEGNAAMQQFLDSNPLVQQVVVNQAAAGAPQLQNTLNAGKAGLPTINPAIVPNEATQRSDGLSSMTKTTINLPNGSQQEVYGDAQGMANWQKDIAKEATKRGKR